MVTVSSKQGDVRSLSKQGLTVYKRSIHVSKKMVSAKHHHSGGLSSTCKERPFSKEWLANRQKINEVLSLYRELLEDRTKLNQLSQENGKNPEMRSNSGIMVHIRAARVLEKIGKWVNNCKEAGHVLGIKVGDEFFWRGELSIVGLHHEFQKGIACVKSLNGKVRAISIVDSGRYANVVRISSDKLVYSGEGGNPNLGGGVKAKDQRLSGGNLALKNSMDDKTPVRLIRRVNNNDNAYKFVYEGLFRVTEYWKERGNLVHMFTSFL